MKVNKDLINEFKKSNSKLLAVTKYWDLNQIKEYFNLLTDDDLDIFI
jgi:uncharacterized pyridoxal phosphate-containing UPF0001 family protein